jgi:phage-related protein
MIQHPKLNIIFFKGVNGREPVRDWLKQLQREEKKLIGADILKIQYCWPIGMPLCRCMGDGLWEIRSCLSTRKIARVFFSVYKRDIVLLHGIIKKSQQTPSKDLELAYSRMYQYSGLIN